MSIERNPIIALDAMGHDEGPDPIVSGALDAARSSAAQIILVGNEAQIGPMLNGFGTQRTIPRNIEVKHADTVFEMGQVKHPKDIKENPNASVVQAANLVAKGDADIVMSAGDTAASVMTGRQKIRKEPGIRQPVIASTVPGIQHPTILLDTGASRTTEMTPEQAMERAYLGADLYTRMIDTNTQIRYGVLNIGEELGKGSPELIEVQLAMQTELRNLFAGNVQGNDIFTNSAGETGEDTAHVIVTSGAMGNLFLKTTKGAVKFMNETMKQAAHKNWFNKIIGQAFKWTVGKEATRTLDYEQHASAPLLGLQKPFVILHGSSSPRAVEHGIYKASKIAKSYSADEEVAA